jgi:hypothetical protein
MYSEFKGKDFLNDYFQNRITLLQALVRGKEDKLSALDQNIFNEANKILLKNKNLVSKIPDNLLPPSMLEVSTLNKTDLPQSFPNTHKIETKKLLDGLLYAYIQRVNLTEEIWLSRLIQRFEVTKKLKEYYLPGFRKSDGSYSEIQLYQLFSIILAIAHSQSGHLQYLSTLLKVNDLILSLPLKTFDAKDSIPSWRMGVVLEIVSISSILQS